MKNYSQMAFWVSWVWAIVIFILCAMPPQDIPEPGLNIPHLDKIVHWGMFFIMSLLLCYLLESRTRFRINTIYRIAVGVSFIYGGLIEILQYYFFNRGGDIWDLLGDIIGGITGCLFYPVIKKWIK